MAEPSGDSEPIYFWRETDPQNGYLSQWYYCPFRDDKDPNIIYETAEQYVQSICQPQIKYPIYTSMYS